MAGMTYQNWVQNFFYGGFADDKFLGIKNSFQYAKGVEIRENPNSLTLARSVDKISGSVVDTAIKSMVTISTTGDLIMFGSNGKIFRRVNNTGSVTLVYTDTGNAAILNGFEYNGYLYWATAANLHRIAISAIDADWTGSVTEDYKTFLVGNANAHPMIEISNILYIGDGKYLAELDSFGTFTGNRLSIFGDEEIRALTWNGKLCRIYSRKSTHVDYGAQYFWNGTSVVYNDRIIWEGLTIHTAFNKDGYDYVIAGKRPIIFVTSDYQRIPLKALPMIGRIDDCEIAPNGVTLFENLLVIAACAGGTNTIGRGAWTFGKFNKNYPEVINFDYPTSNDNVTDKVYCVHQNNGALYLSWGNSAGTTFGVDMVSTTTLYRATGELVSLVMYGSLAEYLKELKRLGISFKPTAVNEKIEIFLRKNLASTWPATPEITVPDSKFGSTNSYAFLESPAAIGDFNFIEVKIILTAGLNRTTTPTLTGISLVFDPNIDTNQNVGQS